MCSYVEIVVLLVSFVQDTLYSFPSDIQKDESSLILFCFWDFHFEYVCVHVFVHECNLWPGITAG